MTYGKNVLVDPKDAVEFNLQGFLVDTETGKFRHYSRLFSPDSKEFAEIEQYFKSLTK